jgi:hypothetical protein
VAGETMTTAIPTVKACNEQRAPVRRGCAKDAVVCDTVALRALARALLVASIARVRCFHIERATIFWR